MEVADLQLRIYGSASGPWHSDFQQGAEEFYGYCVMNNPSFLIATSFSLLFELNI